VHPVAGAGFCSRFGAIVLLLAWVMLWCPDPCGAETWARTYGEQDLDHFESIQLTQDGGAVLCGYRNASTWPDAWVLKLDAAGDREWEWRYGWTRRDDCMHVIQTADLGYLAVGGRTRDTNDTGVWVLKLDPSGAVQWQRSFETADWSRAGGAVQAPDGGFVVMAQISKPGTSDIWLLKLDAIGECEWQRLYSSPRIDSPEELTAVSGPGGGLALVGRTHREGETLPDFLILRLDWSGSILWQKIYGGDSSDIGNSIQPTSDGGFITAGNSQSFGAPGLDGWVLKLDRDGAVEWQGGYGTSHYEDFRSIREDPGRGYLASGLTDRFGAGQDLWVVALDPQGGIRWQKAYSGPDRDWATFIRPTARGALLAGGWTESHGAGGSDGWLLRLDPWGDLGAGCPLVRETSVSFYATNALVQDADLTVTDTAVSATEPEYTATAESTTLDEMCLGPGCDRFVCDALLVEPQEGCSGREQTFTLIATGGEPPVTVEWDFEDDGTFDATGNPLQAALPLGTWTVRGRATDACVDPAAQTCSLVEDVRVHPLPQPNLTPAGSTEFCRAMGESLILDAEAGFASYRWERNGAEIPGETSPSLDVALSGVYRVLVTDANGCEGASDPVDVNAEACVPGETSCVPAGEPPLRVVRGLPALAVEREPLATAFNIYTDVLGSWYAPSAATGSLCTVTNWTDNGDGTVTLTFDPPLDSWVLVTASNPWGEGPAGPDAAGTERTTLGVWDLCGPAP